MTLTELVEHAIEIAATLVPDVPSSVIVLDDDTVRRTFARPGMPTATWEAESVMEAPTSTRGVLVAPVELDGGEMLHIVAVDLQWGIDLYRCVITRGGDEQEVLVGPIERFAGQVRLHPTSPGYVLIQAMRAYGEVHDAAS